MPPRAAAQVFVEDLEAPALSREDEHHLGAALRLRPGEQVIACDGAGGWRTLVVAAGARGRGSPLALELAGEIGREPRPEPALTVAFPLVKASRPDWAVQKLTEIGVDRIVPLLTGWQVVRPEGAAADLRTERFRRVAREAAMQSRRLYLPTVDALTRLPDVIAEPGVAVGDADGGPPSLEHPTVLVGPEGGFREGEVPDELPRVRLGPHVLRTETAAVVAGTLLVGLREALIQPA